SGEASARLLALPELAAAGTVAGFSALKGEIDPAPALEALALRGARVALLRAGRFGILEPDPGAPEVRPEEVDVFLLPGLAFDGDGHRLGFGGGYYDELGPLVRGLLVGVAFDFQLVERCPAGEGDVPVDCVVTDARVVRCRAPRAEGSP